MVKIILNIPVFLLSFYTTEYNTSDLTCDLNIHVSCFPLPILLIVLVYCHQTIGTKCFIQVLSLKKGKNSFKTETALKITLKKKIASGQS